MKSLRSEVVNPFIQASVETFETMCDLVPVRDGKLQMRVGVFGSYDLLGIIGLSGDVRGAVLLTMPIDTGQKLVSEFLGEPVTEVNSDLLDGLGELLNIIAGAAAAKLVGLQVRLALPTVFVGQGQRLSAKESSPWVVIPMQLPGMGPFNVEVSIEEA